MTDTQNKGGKVLHLTAADFQKTIDEAGDKPVFVDFFAEWCGPCKAAGPVIDKLAGEMTDVIFAKVDVDANHDLAGQYQVMSIPTVIVFKDKKPAVGTVGFPGEQGYRQLIEKAKTTPAA